MRSKTGNNDILIANSDIVVLVLVLSLFLFFIFCVVKLVPSTFLNSMVELLCFGGLLAIITHCFRQFLLIKYSFYLLILEQIMTYFSMDLGV